MSQFTLTKTQEIKKTMLVLQDNIAYLEWFETNARNREVRFKIPKLIERTKKQFNYLKTIK